VPALHPPLPDISFLFRREHVVACSKGSER
jgi:hypothetical protein